MEAVSNSPPLIALSRLQKLELLEHFFGTVSIPVEVHDEVVTRGGTLYGAREVAHATWIQVFDPLNTAADVTNCGLEPIMETIFIYNPPIVEILLIRR